MCFISSTFNSFSPDTREGGGQASHLHRELSTHSRLIHEERAGEAEGVRRLSTHSRLIQPRRRQGLRALGAFNSFSPDTEEVCGSAPSDAVKAFNSFSPDTGLHWPPPQRGVDRLSTHSRLIPDAPLLVKAMAKYDRDTMASYAGLLRLAESVRPAPIMLAGVAPLAAVTAYAVARAWTP